jgi:hypothetical protein
MNPEPPVTKTCISPYLLAVVELNTTIYNGGVGFISADGG